jgi:hypothetical protein
MPLNQSDTLEPNLLPSANFYYPLWKRLLLDVRDRWFPEKLPPLQLTSRPMNVGMLVGDIVSLPWYRTVFTNIGNVITPETLPPLELESRPVDVGELISDQMSHLWWTSLLRNLADRVAPERLPPLDLSSKPVDTALRSDPVQVVRWSSLIALPRVPPAERAVFVSTLPRPASTRPVTAPQFAAATLFASSDTNRATPEHAHGHKLRSAITWSRVREAVLIAIVIVEGSYLVASTFGLI